MSRTASTATNSQFKRIHRLSRGCLLVGACVSSWPSLSIALLAFGAVGLIADGIAIGRHLHTHLTS